MNQKVKDLIQKIVGLAAEKSITTKASVFVDFDGNVQSLAVRVYRNGWNRETAHTRPDHKLDIYVYGECASSEDETVIKLKAIYDLLLTL